MEQEFSSFEEFWPYYLSLHRNPINRRLHLVGTTSALTCLALGLLRSPKFLLATPVAGYAFAWAGHFFFEKNAPATFAYPLWSLRADFRMAARMLARQLE